MVLVVIPMTSFGQSTEELLAGNIYKQGMTGARIELLEQALLKSGYLNEIHVDQTYNRATTEAVKIFQMINGLDSDGIVGPVTLGFMSELKLFDADTQMVETVQKTVTSRGTSRADEQVYGEYLNWSEIYGMFIKQESTVLIEDFYTGVTFEVMMTYGHNHFDVEALTTQDSATIKALWGGEWSWARRPVLVHVGDRVIAASLNGMPHAGLDSVDAGTYVSSRSAGYGYGYNYDFVKNNDMDGHICLHFRNSRLHVNNKQDWKHQEAVKVAAGLK